VATTNPQVIGPASVGSQPAALELTSPAFAPGSPIPAVHTCDGAGVSPPLEWGATPEGTVELALTVIDVDAGAFVHWVVAGIDPSVQGFAEGVLPDGAVQATNGMNTIGWTGPCPPNGPAHHYLFTLHALTQPSGVTNGESGADAFKALGHLPGATATLVGTYQRAG
jgi:Raf kinase inhibitor-like YbhB/YbcL family protein